MMQRHRCPVCGKYEFEARSSYDVYEFCGWQDDAYQEGHPGEGELANEYSLNEYKARYNQGWRPDWITDEQYERTRP